MDNNSNAGNHKGLPQRRSIRLKGYDYSQAGLYFITICTQNRACLFGYVNKGEMTLNDAGKMIETEWINLKNRFPNIELHEYVTMPNHFHGILEIVGAPLVGAQNKTDTSDENGQPQGIACNENGQPQNGQPQNGQPQNGQPQNGQPQNGQPQNGQSQNGQSQNGQSQNGQSQNGQSQNGQPQNGQPQNGQSQNGKSQNGQSQNGQPQNVQPQNGQPQNGQPQNGQPQNGQPQNGQPQNGQPQNGQPQNGQPQGIAPTAKTVGDMMDAFKSIVTVEYIRGVKNRGWKPFDGKLWQRNYWEHIIRNDDDYQRISNYIINNPKNWDNDKLKS